MAPRRLPTALKKQRGTYRPSRENPREPQPERVRPRAPKSLPPVARSLWRDLVAVLDEAKVLTVADITALTLACEAWADYRAADEVVQAEGITYRSQTPNGTIVRPHPAVAIREGAWKRVERMLGRFGLTPSDRTKVAERKHVPTEGNAWDDIL